MDETTPTFTLNGEPLPLPPGLTVAALLIDRGLDANKVAVERNRRLVRGDRYADTPVEPGDALEIVTFVGGG